MSASADKKAWRVAPRPGAPDRRVRVHSMRPERLAERSRIGGDAEPAEGLLLLADEEDQVDEGALAGGGQGHRVPGPVPSGPGP